MFKKIKNFIIKHKIISGIIAIILVVVAFYSYKFLAGSSQETKYTIGTVEKGTIISSVVGTGQISASDQLAIKAEASGDIVYLNTFVGQEVVKGKLLTQIDTKIALQDIQDAQDSLDSAKISLEKIKGTDDTVVAKNKQQAENDLEKDYEDGFITIGNAFLDLQTIITGLEDLLFKYTISNNQQNINYYGGDNNSAAYVDYQSARLAYNTSFQNYRNLTRSSDRATIELMLEETNTTTKKVFDATKSAVNLVLSYKDGLSMRGITPIVIADTHLTTLNSYISKLNSHLSSLLNAITGIEDGKDAIVNADLNLRSEELSYRQKENALADAKDKLSNYYIYAPFDGIISEVNINKGDSVSSGTSAIGIVSKKQIAEVSLNEVDVAKIKLGDKVNSTFDAVDGLTLTGRVAEIDAVGTVSQGVVSYQVKIAFDTQDDRIKPGMSISAVIITGTKQDVLMVRNGAVKSKNGSYYVEVIPVSVNTNESQTISSSRVQPEQRSVEIGIADDTNTEIVSGLAEGEKVIVKTSTSSNKTVSSTSTGGGIFGGQPMR